jgi:hypothetical protein
LGAMELNLSLGEGRDWRCVEAQRWRRTSVDEIAEIDIDRRVEPPYHSSHRRAAASLTNRLTPSKTVLPRPTIAILRATRRRGRTLARRITSGLSGGGREDTQEC